MTTPSFEETKKLFGIVDETPSIQLPSSNLVFTTNVFIPMENNFNDKFFLYLSGFVKLVETFQVRIANSELKSKNCTSKNCMLYIFYDSMFNQEYDDSKYVKQQNNNNKNIKIKDDYLKNKDKLKKLLRDYKIYLDMIKRNVDGRYSFIKLFSFDCSKLNKKRKGYLGHPDTFGSIVRFLPFFDPNIEVVFSINISHALSPRLCFLINNWLASEKQILTNNYQGYFHSPRNNGIAYFFEVEYKGKYDLPKKRPAAGLFGLKNIPEIQKDLNERFNEIINRLIINENENIILKYSGDDSDLIKKKWFMYGIDEVILSMVIWKYTSSKICYYFNGGNFEIIEKKIFGNELENLLPIRKSRFFFQFDELKKQKEIHEKINQLQQFKDIITITSFFNIKINNTESVLETLSQEELQHLYDILLILKKDICDFFLNREYEKYLSIDRIKSVNENYNDEIKKAICDNVFEYNGNSLEIKEKTFNFLSKLGIINKLMLAYTNNELTTHRFISRRFLREIGKEKLYLDYLSKEKGYSFAQLLSSFNEEEPLIVFDDEEKLKTNFLPIYHTRFFGGIPDLIENMIAHYTDPRRTLPIPYRLELEPEPILGGYKITKTNKKKSKTKKSKTKKSKTKK
jgi:hypothetical protein